MGQWSLRERLQPSLLDRITDRDPDRRKESSAQQSMMNERLLKEAVMRDLGWLLNSVSLDVIEDLSGYDHARHSVINYGLPDLSGHTSATIDVTTLEAAVKRAIQEFEPRIIRNSLRVRVRSNPGDMSHNSLMFEIEGAVFNQPAPFQVMLRSQLDLECGEFNVTEV
jgi:type VI secretion system protein ImpF